MQNLAPIRDTGGASNTPPDQIPRNGWSSAGLSLDGRRLRHPEITVKTTFFRIQRARSRKGEVVQVSKPENPPPPLEDRKHLTFEQAEGAEPLPSQLKPKELSAQLRALLWETIYKSIEECRFRTGELLEPWERISYLIHVDRHHGMADEFVSDFHGFVARTKPILVRGDYLAVFGWIQYVLRRGPPSYFAENIQCALERARAAYRVVDGDTIVPLASQAESETIARAFADLAANEFHGARQHLRKAAEELTNGNDSASIRESIHAVEFVVRVLEPKGDFAKALGKLDAKVGIHGAMKAGFGNLYGYTSDEKGLGTG